MENKLKLRLIIFFIMPLQNVTNYRISIAEQSLLTLIQRNYKNRNDFWILSTKHVAPKSALSISFVPAESMICHRRVFRSIYAVFVEPISKAGLPMEYYERQTRHGS